MDGSIRVVRLASDPQENGVWCGPDGLALAGRSLLRQTESGFAPRPMAEIQRVFDTSYGAGLDAESYWSGLAGVARSLNKGDLPLAMIGSLLLKLPELPGSADGGWQADSKTAFNRDQPRDENGRWTDGTTGEARQTPPVDFIADHSSAFTDLQTATAEADSLATMTPEIVGLLGRFAGIMSGPVALAAALLIPTNGSNIHEGTLPGLPGLTYRSDEGIVTISRLDAAGNIENLYHGAPDADGFYRDDQGDIIGRHVGTGVMFDTDALTEMAAKTDKPPEVGTDASTGLDTAPMSDDDKPKVCSLPTIENIYKRSARSLAYQSQMTALPIGFDMEYRGVRFDGCDEDTGRMIEAKGPGLLWLLNKPYDDLIQTDFYKDMMKKASRQSEASEGRGDDYYFADEPLATFFDKEFKRAGYTNIVVHHVEAIIKKLEDCVAWVMSNLDAWRLASSQSIIAGTSPLLMKRK